VFSVQSSMAGSESGLWFISSSIKPQMRDYVLTSSNYYLSLALFSVLAIHRNAL